ncbi:UDP-3-O-(3-hydroxymyristoyl)glucosamine N-acyltransferase [Trichlorobacter lovleyi]|uniref:UDP-3-O-(3-hydroxymyristoyl)glucosamine N-acyltransferase n=1 Tax=Trichlorobacter lovleyi TaxID=313985 RepID=UPI00223FF27D|nr:UDP-3-O-(3-hydroxymyristoyl)glucosamine N-acyltransferase [Trichlorobacter lovleyi]QOX80632.1 UDP-3-O-(3-hydroxymyristoyl)glucosamine N-acyltransferase [Trichlorobacter lovleyi]
MMLTKTLQELADHLGGTVRGDGTIKINGLAPLEGATPDKITFLANPKYAAKVAETRAGGVLMAPGGESYGRNVIELANPYLGFAKLLKLFYTQPHPALGVLPEAVIGTNVVLGEGISIYPGAVVGNNVSIGDRVVIYPGAVIYDGVVIGDECVIHANAVVRERCRLGKRCKLQPGAVVGSDGFGYAPDGPSYYPIPQIGIVVLEDDVEIGANAAVDRAALEVTLIRRGTKLDNLVQVAHNCQIGEDCMIVSQVGIAGSSKIGNHVTLAGQVGVVGHVSIGDNVIVGAQAGVPGSLEGNAYYSGSPAMPHKEWLKTMGTLPKLPEMRKKMNEYEKRLAALEARLVKE